MSNKRFKEIFLFRHGQTDWNKDNLIQGLSNIPLNIHGVIQAEELGSRLSHFDISHIFSSDLERAKHTATIVSSICSCNMSLHQILREQNFGVAEGKDRLDIRQKYAALFTVIDDISNCESNTACLPGAETRLQVFNRISNAIKNWADASEDKRIGISTHGGVILSLISVQYNKMVQLDNGQYLTLFYDRIARSFSGFEIS